MKKAIVSLLLTFLAAFGYVAVDRATDDRLSALEDIVASQNAVLATVQKTDWQVGDKIPVANFNAPLEWHHNNGAVSVITKCEIEVIQKRSLEDVAKSTEATTVPTTTAVSIIFAPGRGDRYDTQDGGTYPAGTVPGSSTTKVPTVPAQTVPTQTTTHPDTFTVPTMNWLDNTRVYTPYTCRVVVEGKTDAKYAGHDLEVMFNTFYLRGTIQADGTFHLVSDECLLGNEKIIIRGVSMSTYPRTIIF